MPPALSAAFTVRLAVAQADTPQAPLVPLGIGNGLDGYAFARRKARLPEAFKPGGEGVKSYTDTALAAKT
jgi:hypothetical protein